jgi:hypothetical protein
VKRTLPLLIVLAFHCTFTIHGAVVTTTANQRSENGLFSADISSTAPNEIIVGIHRHDDDVKTFSWSKKVPWNGANATITAFPWIKRYISNDGETVILHNQQQFRNEWWVWISKNGEPVRYYPHDLDRWLGQRSTSINPRYANPYATRPETLQFVFDAKGVHALWVPSLDKWLTIDLKTGALNAPAVNLGEAISTLPLNAPRTGVWLKPPSEDLVSVLNAEATRRSLAAVRRHQPTAIKTMLRPIQEKLGEFIASLKPSQSQLALSECSAAYLFLARHKVPEGEKYIRKLLEMPIEQTPGNTGLTASGPELRFQFSVSSNERMLGDMAWRYWNDIAVNVPTVNSGYAFDQDRSTHYLGGVRGSVRLPIVRPDTKPGTVWVYLIPAGIKSNEWAKSRSVVTLVCQLDSGPASPRRFPGQFQFDSFDYRFSTISPGEYRLKAVWDRRPPFAPPEGIALPEPGDYESVESAPFTISTNSTAVGLDLLCTNKVGQAETYYAADESWKKLNPRPVRSPYYGPGGLTFGGARLQYRDEFSETHRWVIKNKVVAKNIELRRAEVIQVLPIGAPLERDELIVTFAIQDLSDPSLRKLVPQIRDEHGCDFKATLFVPALRPGPGEITVRAGAFPRKKEFSLTLRSATENKVICSYSIKNGGSSQLAQWRARPLPLSRTIEGRNVRLISLSRSAGAKFQLVDSNDTGGTTDWTPESTVYQDREGNRSFEADDFCQKENQVKIQIIQGSRTREFITEFQDKR